MANSDTFYSPNKSGPICAAKTKWRKHEAAQIRNGANMAVKRAPFEYRTDPAVPRFSDDRPIIVFDGKCVFCSGFAQFVLRADRQARFRLLAAQSALGDALYRHFGLDPVNYETYILLEHGVAYFRSEAALRILEGLGGPW
ncbi:MAG: DCC1-like thiol-disulfide oxidoreductase family protein, partial [Xanthobacteraceae bacterium]